MCLAGAIVLTLLNAQPCNRAELISSFSDDRKCAPPPPLLLLFYSLTPEREGREVEREKKTPSPRGSGDN